MLTRFGSSSPFAPYTLPPTAITGATVGQANQAWYMRVNGSGPVSQLLYQVTATFGNVCLGIFRNQGAGIAAQPGAMVYSSGILPCPAVGAAAVALPAPVYVNAGDWFALASDDTGAAFVGVNAAQSGIYPGLVCRAQGQMPLVDRPTIVAASSSARAFAIVGG